MESKTLSYEKFIKCLVYDINLSMPINEEAWDIDFPFYTTLSKDNFVRYILSLSYWYKEQLVVDKSHPEHHKYRFKCSYKGCRMKLSFKTKNGKLFINCDEKKTSFIHDTISHNHSVPKYRMIETTQKNFIMWSDHHGDISQFIQVNPELKEFPCQNLYNIRTLINKKLNNVYHIIEQLQTTPLFISKILKKGDVIIGCIIINRVMIKSNYCDIIIIDDTVGVVKLGYPVECIACKDANGRIQLVAFGYISGKDTEAYEEFFTMFQELAKEEREQLPMPNSFGKIIVCDRSKAQTKGVSKVFSESHIIYCTVHIQRNIESNLGVGTTLAKACQEMFHFRTEPYESNYIRILNDLPDNKFKSELIKEKKHYIPSEVDKLYHRGILTSNAAEAVFGVLKRSCDSKKHPLLTILEKFMYISEKWMNESIRCRTLKPTPIFMKLIDMNVGNWAIEYLQKEMNAMVIGECHCLKVAYGLPCRHDIAKDFNVIYEVGKKVEYLRMNRSVLSEINKRPAKCVVEEKDKEPKVLDIDEVIKELKGMEGTTDILNEMAQKGIDYLNRTKGWKRTETICVRSSCPTRFSKNCDKYLKKKKVSKQENQLKKPKGEKKERKEKKPKKEYTTVLVYK